MYNFSGMYYRIWAVAGILLLIGITCVLIQKPWAKKFIITDYKFEIVAITIAVFLGIFYISRILVPDISLYTGEFVETHRNSRVAPPLPFTSEYVFWDGDGKRKVLYLDTFSKKDIFPHELESGQVYKVYYDKLTKVITRIDIIECENTG